MTRLQDVPGRNQDLTWLLEDLFEAGVVHLDEPDDNATLRGVSRSKRFRSLSNGKLKRIRGRFAGNKAWRQNDDSNCEWNNDHRNRQKERELRALDDEDIEAARQSMFFTSQCREPAAQFPASQTIETDQPQLSRRERTKRSLRGCTPSTKLSGAELQHHIRKALGKD